MTQCVANLTVAAVWTMGQRDCSEGDSGTPRPADSVFNNTITCLGGVYTVSFWGTLANTFTFAFSINALATPCANSVEVRVGAGTAVAQASTLAGDLSGGAAGTARAVRLTLRDAYCKLRLKR